MKQLYKRVLKPLVFQIDPELVHNFFIWFGELLGYNPITRKIVAVFYQYKGDDISKVVDGVEYKYPVILAAGFDYDARLTQILSSMSFGGEEAGSITYLPYEGNKKPRLTRLKKSKSIIVNKGLKSEGVHAVINRLKKRKRFFVNGLSIARSNNPDVATTEAGAEDYYKTLKLLSENGLGDYYTINISCPNASTGETFTTPDLLELLLVEVDKVDIGSKPLYLKMPINLAWEDFDSLLKVASKHRVNGLVIGNLNKKYEYLDFREEAPEEYRGGLSGKPCADLSNRLIKQTREKYKDRFTIIGCGGILSAKDAMDKFEAGADLVQLITGMIFEGPHLMKEICQEYNLKYGKSN